MGERVISSVDFNDRPQLFRLVNALWKTGYRLGAGISLDKDDLIKTARKNSGLYDLGKDFNEEPLERLLRSIKEEARLHPVGAFITRKRMISLLEMRLRAEYFFKKYPHILERDLYPAWFIIGLQRTGTTKLQRLLATDPDHRVLLSWEAINPVPLSTSFRPSLNEKQDFEKRIRLAKTSAKALKIMSPGFNAIHPVSIFQPEEDILLLDVSFMSTTPEAMMNVPSYSEWLENTDQSQAYEYYIKLLKLLQWQRPAKRWILKSPHHLEFADVINSRFSAPLFLWSHRNIYESIPSFLSMITYTHMIFSDHIDVQEIANHWVRKTGYMLNKALNFRKNEDSSFIDLFYDDMIKDSAAQLSRIYSYNGNLKKDQLELFKLHENENFHRKYGKHQYSLADFRLTTSDIDKYTSGYQTFIANHEPGKNSKI